ncbi:MAG TPA: glycosyltransferase [Chloroflexota bacterium]|nr:glycosyltransferase [Chloroflexota bacterium]
MIECSIGIMAYNEEANIGAVLDALLRQELHDCAIREIIVVASGCTDRTEEIVRAYERESSLVRLLSQSRREGKASAINLFLAEAAADVVVLVGADTLPDAQTIDFLVKPFERPCVGMTGGRPIPLNDPNGFLGRAVHFQWKLHDRIASCSPKLGELIAFRRAIGSIPVDTAVDEVSVEARVHARGWELVYVPAAVVHNRGPSTIGDFLRQRRRIYAGHLQVSKESGYRPSTMNLGLISRILAQEVRLTPSFFADLGFAMGLELVGRALGRMDYLRRRDHRVWQRVDSTKDLFLGRRPRHLTRERVMLTLRLLAYDTIQSRLGRRGAQKCLSRLSDLVRTNIRTSDTLTVLSQDGVVVVLARTDADGGETMAGRIQVKLHTTSDLFDESLESPTCDIDCQVYPLEREVRPSLAVPPVQPDVNGTLAGLGG